MLKGYSSDQSHFSEINAKLAEKNKFGTHFVQKCIETRENEQNVVLNESSEGLRNRSEIIWIYLPWQQLMMTRVDVIIIIIIIIIFIIIIIVSYVCSSFAPITLMWSF